MIEKTETTAIAPEGLEDIDARDIVFPRIKLIQPVSAGDAGGKPGEFINDLTGEVFGERKIQFARLAKGQVLWHEESDVPLCLSRDGKTPDTSIENPPSVECELCPQTQWVDGKRPNCAKTYEFAIVDLETGMPCVLQLSRTGEPAAKQAISYAFLNMAPMREVRCTLKSKEVRSGRNTYYVVVFSDFAREAHDKAAELAAMEV
jgi:hypothetical protein